MGWGKVVQVSEAMSATSQCGAKWYSWQRLVLTISVAVLGATVPGLMGTGKLAILIGTVLAALLTAFFLAEGSPSPAKVVTALALTVAAVILTISGFTLLDIIRKDATIGDGQYTFLPDPPEPLIPPVIRPPGPTQPPAAAPEPAPAPAPAPPAPAPAAPEPPPEEVIPPGDIVSA